MAETIFDAENGTDNTALTTANVPANSTLFNGSVMQFDNVAAANGSLGYRFQAGSAVQQNVRLTLTSNVIQSVRYAVNFPTVPGGLRVFSSARLTGGNSIRFRAQASAGSIQLQWVDSAQANPVTMTQLLTPATWYDLSMVLNTTGTTKYSINLYSLNDVDPINPTPYTSTTYSMGAAALTHFDFGFNDAATGAAEMYVDNIKINDGLTTHQGPFATPATLGSRRVWDGSLWR